MKTPSIPSISSLFNKSSKKIEVEEEELSSEEEKKLNEQYSKYKDNYSEVDLEQKIRFSAKAIGEKLCSEFIYLGKLVTSNSSPLNLNKKYLKPVIIGVLGYFILPTDIIPDFIPGAGFADDAAAIAAILKILKDVESPSLKKESEEKAKSLFKE